MRFLGRDNDGKFDPYLSAWLGLAILLWAGIMYVLNFGDATLQIFFVICGLVPLALNHTMHRRTNE